MEGVARAGFEGIGPDLNHLLCIGGGGCLLCIGGGGCQQEGEREKE